MIWKSRLKIKISGFGFNLDGSNILLSEFVSGLSGYSDFQNGSGSNLGSNPNLR